MTCICSNLIRYREPQNFIEPDDPTDFSVAKYSVITVGTEVVCNIHNWIMSTHLFTPFKIALILPLAACSVIFGLAQLVESTVRFLLFMVATPFFFLSRTLRNNYRNPLLETVSFSTIATFETFGLITKLFKSHSNISIIDRTRSQPDIPIEPIATIQVTIWGTIAYIAALILL